MKKEHLHKLIIAALFAALACVATMIIQIPTPTQGYVNLGDSIVILSGLLLGPLYGFASAAIGSAMADMLLGYMHYIPATFLIKGLMALAAYYLMKAFQSIFRGKSLPAVLFSSAFAECIMVFGYFGYEAAVLQYGLAATAGMTGNIMQALMGSASSSVLYLLIRRIPQAKRFLEK